jgi:hypothetical protein
MEYQLAKQMKLVHYNNIKMGDVFYITWNGRFKRLNKVLKSCGSINFQVWQVQ